jgi:hypothetical protein
MSTQESLKQAMKIQRRLDQIERTRIAAINRAQDHAGIARAAQLAGLNRDVLRILEAIEEPEESNLTPVEELIK